jgi:hypothetical protein
MTWSITIFNPDGSVHGTPTGGNQALNAPGAGKPVNIPSLAYTCGHNHTLTGTQNTVTSMSGTGVNPWPDPGVKALRAPRGGNPSAGTTPTWDASGGSPMPKPKEKKYK